MIDSTPLVSVVIPTYNAGSFICDAIASVIGQTWKNLEIIVVDDGSTDDTGVRVKNLSDSRIKYAYQDNASQAVARNKGISLSQGEYVAFLDSDDMWHRDKLEKQMRLFENPSTGLVYSRLEYFEPEKKIKSSPNNPCYRGKVFKKLLFDNFIPCSSVVLRKSLLDSKHMFRTRRKGVEDWDLWLRLSLITEFNYIDETLVKYRSHGQSVSHDMDLMMKSVEVTIGEIGNEIRESFSASEAKKCLALLNGAFAREYMAYAHWLLMKKRICEAKSALAKALEFAPFNLRIFKDIMKFKIKEVLKILQKECL